MTAQAGGASSLSVQRQEDDLADRNVIRRQLRRARRELPRATQQQAARRVAQQLTCAMILRPGRRIGIYLAMPGELNLGPTIERAWLRGCHLFVPHIVSTTRGEMEFYPYTRDSRLVIHRWGIPQLAAPVGRSSVSTLTLDAVLVPIVAFDANGHRLGMGAAFYDRHFARLRSARQWHRPRLIGVAYSFQQIAAIAAQAHDVPLDAVVTESAFTTFARAE
jgi:5-formyltetrahydrofolate cyclo-ligase